MKSLSRAVIFAKEYVIKHKIISGVMVVVIIGAVYYVSKSSAATTLTLQYGRVRMGSVAQTVSGTGQVSETSQVELKPKVNANVTQVLVSQGQKVYKGQVLFRLDARDAYKQVRDASLNLDQANIALQKLKQPAETIDILTLENSIKKAQLAKTTQDTNVNTAYSNLLNGGLQAVPDLSYTSETAPTISGTYNKKTEGKIHINISQGTEGSLLTLSGLASGVVQYSSAVGQPIGDTGLFIKFNSPQSAINWTIDIPNKRSSTYLSLTNAYTSAQQNRDISNLDSDRQIAEYTQKLEDLKRGAKDVDLTAQELVVQQRQNALADANNNLSDYTIVAPFAGTMASVTAQVGLSAVTAASNGATSLGTIVTDSKIAQITLNETDIAKVHVGQSAVITFDALDGVTATGTVADIDGLGTVTQGVVTYKVKIAFDTVNPSIKSSMSVSVDITTDSKDNVLTVPNGAVKKDSTGNYVESDGSVVPSFTNASSTARLTDGTSTRRMMRGTTTAMTSGTGERVASSTRQVRTTVVPATTVFTKIPVTIGVKGTTMTEIVSGLNEGEQIIVKKTTTTAKSTTAPSITSLFRPGGNQARPAGAAGAPARGQ